LENHKLIDNKKEGKAFMKKITKVI